MKAFIKTKSNYKNCNGRELEVVEIQGKMICCLVPENGFDKEGNEIGGMINADFNIEKELISLR